MFLRFTYILSILLVFLLLSGAWPERAKRQLSYKLKKIHGIMLTYKQRKPFIA